MTPMDRTLKSIRNLLWLILAVLLLLLAFSSPDLPLELKRLHKGVAGISLLAAFGILLARVVCFLGGLFIRQVLRMDETEETKRSK